MSGPESKRPDDSALDDFLAGRSEVSRAYRAASDESAPSSLDAAVLQMAQAAVAQHPPRRRRWRLPLAAAAVLLFSFGSLRLIVDEPGLRREALMEAEHPVAGEPSAMPAASGAAPFPAASDEAVAEKSARPPPPPAHSDAGKLPAAKQKKEAAEARADLQAQVAAETQAQSLSRKIAPSAPLAPRAAGASANLSAGSSGDSLAPPPVAVMPEQPAASPAPAPSMSAPVQDAPDVAASREAHRAMDAEAARQDVPLTADAWIQRIRELLARGERERAQQELRRLRDRYPDVELPPDLRPLLPPAPVRPAGRP